MKQVIEPNLEMAQRLALSHRNCGVIIINMFKDQEENMDNMYEHMGNSAGRWKQ